LTKSHHPRFCHRRHCQPHWHCPCHCRDAVAFASAVTAVIVFIVSIVVGPAAANAAIAAVTAVTAVTAVAAVVAAAVAAATTIAATAAVVDCYVFVTPSLDFDDAGRRRRHP
jgi:hypothetical protein